jgi:lecithin:retinol acyltransferase
MFLPVPGSVIKAKSLWPFPDHLGIVGWPLADGTITVIDSTEVGVSLRTMRQFALGRAVELLWVPQTANQQSAVLDRALSQIGHPYDLFRANCEHFVHWVIKGEVKSRQLKRYVASLALVGLGAYLYGNQEHR